MSGGHPDVYFTWKYNLEIFSMVFTEFETFLQNEIYDLSYSIERPCVHPHQFEKVKGLKFHMNCLKKSVQRLNLSSYDHKSGICTICFQKMDVFFCENFVHWENPDLTQFKYLN